MSSQSPLYEKYKDIMIVYYDLETTGLNTNTAEIIEIAAEVEPSYKQNVQTNTKDTFAALVCPESGIIPASASQVNGILFDAVKSQPLFCSIAKTFLLWLDEWRHITKTTHVIIVAHNNTDYDSKIFKRECKKNKIDIPSFLLFGDSLTTFRECFPYPERRFNLQALAELWIKHTKPKQDHRAATDVKMLILVIHGCPSTRDFFDCLITACRKNSSSSLIH